MHFKKAKTTAKTSTKPQHTHTAQNLSSHPSHRRPTSHKQSSGTRTSIPTALPRRTTPYRSPSASGTQPSKYIYITTWGTSIDVPWCPSYLGTLTSNPVSTVPRFPRDSNPEPCSALQASRTRTPDSSSSMSRGLKPPTPQAKTRQPQPQTCT